MSGLIEVPFKGNVLLTGGSGFIASHILDALLDDGFAVVVTARSEAKGNRIVKEVLKPQTSNVSYAVVEDIARAGAFDKVLQSRDFDFVVHTASPYHLNVQDPVHDFLDPAIKGTRGLLESIRAYATTVRRVVMTSSSAAMLAHEIHPAVYNESHWFKVTWEEALDPLNTYKASKVFAETAAWEFVRDLQPKFDLAVINCTFTFGPIQRQLPTLEAMNTSNHRIRDMMQGKMRGGIAPTAPVFTFVDVRDVALAHLRAMTVPEAGGHRFYVVAEHFSNKQIADIIRRAFPTLAAQALPREEMTKDDIPEGVYGFDNTKSRRVLGLEYSSLEKSVVDTVESILQLMGRG